MGDFKRLGRLQRPRRSGRYRAERERAGDYRDQRDQGRCIAGREKGGRLQEGLRTLGGLERPMRPRKVHSREKKK